MDHISEITKGKQSEPHTHPEIVQARDQGHENHECQNTIAEQNMLTTIPYWMRKLIRTRVNDIRHLESSSEVCEEGTHFSLDISNFTGISEFLTRMHGRQSAVMIAELVNEVINKALGIVQRLGGDTVLFGGDAIQVLFEGIHHEKRAAIAAIIIQWELQKILEFRTRPLAVNEEPQAPLIVKIKDEMEDEEEERISKEAIMAAVTHDIQSPLQLDVITKAKSITSKNQSSRYKEKEISIPDVKSDTPYVIEVFLEPHRESFIRRYILPQKNYLSPKSPKFNATSFNVKYTKEGDRFIIEEKYFDIKRKAKIALNTGKFLKTLLVSSERRADNSPERIHGFIHGEATDHLSIVEKNTPSGGICVGESTYQALREYDCLECICIDEQKKIYRIHVKNVASALDAYRKEHHTYIHDDRPFSDKEIDMMRRYFEPQVYEKITRDFSPEIEEVAMVFFNIKPMNSKHGRGTDIHKMEKVFHIISRYFNAYGGIINKFNGNQGLVIFWPAEGSNDLKKATKCVQIIEQKLEEEGYDFFAGMNFEKIFIGRIGQKVNGNQEFKKNAILRSELTCMGDGVNEAARNAAYSEQAKGVAGRTTIRASTLKMKGTKVRHKGKSEITLVSSLEEHDKEVTNFVGREDEISELLKVINDPQNHMVFVQGRNGIGKSRLVSESMRQLEKDMNHPKKILFIECQKNDAPFSSIGSLLQKLGKNPVSAHDINVNNSEAKKTVMRKQIIAQVSEELNENTIVVIEDIEDMDSESLDILKGTLPSTLSKYIATGRECPLANITKLELKRLGNSSIEKIIRQLSTVVHLPASFIEAFCSIAQGNPGKTIAMMRDILSRKSNEEGCIFTFNSDTERYELINRLKTERDVKVWRRTIGIDKDERVNFNKKIEKLPAAEQQMATFCAVFENQPWSRSEIESILSRDPSSFPDSRSPLPDIGISEVGMILDQLVEKNILKKIEDGNEIFYSFKEILYVADDKESHKNYEGNGSNGNGNGNGHHPDISPRDIAEEVHEDIMSTLLRSLQERSPELKAGRHLAAALIFEEKLKSLVANKNLKDTEFQVSRLEESLAIHWYKAVMTDFKGENFKAAKLKAIDYNLKIGKAYIASKKPPQAEKCFSRILEILQDDEEKKRDVQFQMAISLRGAEIVPEAKRKFEELYKIAKKIGNHQEEVKYQNGICGCIEDKEEKIQTYIKIFFLAYKYNSPEYLLKSIYNVFLDGRYLLKFENCKDIGQIIRILFKTLYTTDNSDIDHESTRRFIQGLSTLIQILEKDNPYEEISSLKEVVENPTNAVKKILETVRLFRPNKENMKILHRIFYKLELAFYVENGKLDEAINIKYEGDDVHKLGFVMDDNTQVKAAYYHFKGDFHNAKRYYYDDFQARREKLNFSDTITSKFLCGRSFNLCDDFSKAEEMLREALDHIELIPQGQKTLDTSKNDIMLELCIALWHQGKLEEFHQLFPQITRDRVDKARYAYAFMLIGKYEQAEILARELEATLEKRKREQGHSVENFYVWKLLQSIKTELASRTG